MPFFKTSRPARRRSAAEEADEGPDAVLSVEIAPEGSRAREIKTRSKTRPTGAHPSFRMNRMVHWESDGERNAIKLLDVDPTVVYFAEQPCIIRYRLHGVVRRHYPDLRIVRPGEDCLGEVKTREEASRTDVWLRSDLLQRELPRFGFTYKVLMSELLEAEPRLRNAELLLRSGRDDITLAELEEIRRYLKGRESFAWTDFRDGLAGPITTRKACRLILDGVLSVDLNKTWALPGNHVRVGPPSAEGVI